MSRRPRVFVAGHGGLVGSAIVRALRGHDVELITKTRSELDLREQSAVEAFFASARIQQVYLAAARVGGIDANSNYPADFIRDNLLIQTNVIDAAHRNGVRKLLYLGSSCIYPRLAAQPIREESLLTGPLESTNEWYAVAKIAGLKMCQAYRRQFGFDAIAAMPTNLYGPGDNFDLQTSHVLPALLRKCHEAKVRGAAEIVVWGTGLPRREFLHVDDLAAACVFLMEHYAAELPINVGWGEDIAIADLVSLIKDIVGFGGAVRYDSTKPDGTPRKVLDTGRINSLGWKPTIRLAEGIASTYRWFIDRT